MSEIKLCPKCGKETTRIDPIDNESCFRVRCGNLKCLYAPDTWSDSVEEAIEYWNLRPIEDALTAENQRLREFVKEFIIALMLIEDAYPYKQGDVEALFVKYKEALK